MKFGWMVLLWALAGSACAAWEEVEDTENAVIYIDRSKIYTEAANPKALHLFDFKKKNKLGAMSRRVLMEFDCKLKKRRMLAFSSFSENMAQGSMVSKSADPGQWRPIQSDTVGDEVFKIVCPRNLRIIE